MYPMNYYENFMRYEASDQVLAMPFSKPFQTPPFDTVIVPAIATVLLNDKPFLQPRIINRGTTGSPDIHEQIFDAIIHSRLVIADMTVYFKAAPPTTAAFTMRFLARPMSALCARPASRPGTDPVRRPRCGGCSIQARDALRASARGPGRRGRDRPASLVRVPFSLLSN